MNSYTTQSLVQDQIRESRQQAAAARRASAARASQRRAIRRPGRTSSALLREPTTAGRVHGRPVG